MICIFICWMSKKLYMHPFGDNVLFPTFFFCWFCSSGLCMLSQKSLYNLRKHRRLGISTLPLTYNLLDFKKPNPTHPYFLPSWLYYFVSTSICGWYRLNSVIIGLASTNCELPLDVLFHGGFWAFTTFSMGSPWPSHHLWCFYFTISMLWISCLMLDNR